MCSKFSNFSNRLKIASDGFLHSHSRVLDAKRCRTMRLDRHFMGNCGKREHVKNGECFAPIPVMICRIRRASKFQIKIFKNIGYEGIFSDGFRSFSTAPKSKMLHL